MKNLKYDPNAWIDFKAAKAAPVPSFFHVRLSSPGTVEVDLGDGWRIIGHGEEFKIQMPRPGQVRASVAYAVFVSIDTEIEQLGVPLTNFDKRPGMSSVERMVKQSILEARLQEKLAREKRAQADRETNERRIKAGKQDENPIPPEPVEPEPVVEPTEPTPETANPTAE